MRGIFGSLFFIECILNEKIEVWEEMFQKRGNWENTFTFAYRPESLLILEINEKYLANL